MTSPVGIEMADDDGFAVINIPADADTPAAVIRFLAQSLATDGLLSAAELETVVAEAIHREALGSTGIGAGRAVPHAACSSLSHAAFVVGRTAAPLDWSAADGQPVRLVALVVVVQRGTPAALRAMEEAARRLRNTPS